VVSSVIDLLCTLFNIEAATVVTLSVESYPFVFVVNRGFSTLPHHRVIPHVVGATSLHILVKKYLHT